MTGDKKNVLVVDDEPSVRELVQALLRRCGHLVETAQSGAEALIKLQSSDFDLVFTDWLMPGMTGDQLAREIKKQKPHLPIVLLTGHKPDPIGPEFSRVLAKPFSRDQLSETVLALT